MLLFQEMALGYQIDLTSQELVSIARFLQDLETQRSFGADDISQHMTEFLVDKVYEELE